MSNIKAEIIPNSNKTGHLMLICDANDHDMVYNKIVNNPRPTKLVGAW